MKNLFLLTHLLFLFFVGFAQQAEKTFLITEKYLNYPIEKKINEKVMVSFFLDGEKITYDEIRLARGEPDYWVFTDVSAYMGKELTLVFDKKAEAIDKIYQSDIFWEEKNLYKEKYRPQFHFSTRRGWSNDPNGLVYYDGEYHLYFQHNPYDLLWGNMTWGHAVSSDLVHWKELPITLQPDELGTMFSGSAVIDKNNSAGWGKNALIAVYTASHKATERQTQCIAYSTDKGRTFTKYKKNPVIDSKDKWDSKKTRDPRVFWYAPSNGWVMALFELNGISIYTSKDLKEWKYESHNDGFWECPELFELPVDGDADNTKWVMYGAACNYMIGSFDGKKFTPEAGRYSLTHGSQFAAQTYNNTPDGRRVQIGWGRIEHSPDMNFSQMMTFPTELTLRSTNEGIRLFSEPIREIGKLHTKTHKWSNLNLKDANIKLQNVKGDLIHLKAKIELKRGFKYSLSFRGCSLASYNGKSNKVSGIPFSQSELDKLILDIEVLIDRTTVETFYDNGRIVNVKKLQINKPEEGFRFREWDNSLLIHELEVYELKSAW